MSANDHAGIVGGSCLVMMMNPSILYLVVSSLPDAGPGLVRHQDPGLVRVPASPLTSSLYFIIKNLFFSVTLLLD